MSPLKELSFNTKNTGLVVQLVRIHACHAWGRGFESRPDRQLKGASHEVGRFFLVSKCLTLEELKIVVLLSAKALKV